MSSDQGTPPGDPDVAAAAGNDNLPRINADELDLRIVTTEAWAALGQRNAKAPTLFRHGGVPVRLETEEHAPPVLRELTVDRVLHELARAAEFFTSVKGKRNEPATTRIVLPPTHVAKDLLATPAPPLPIITRITECPVFAPDGTLQITSGYHAASQTFCALQDGLTIEPIPARPTESDLERAKELILGELLVDFPFVSDADRANAVGLGLAPFVRDLIVGPTPLNLIEAPMPGSGKDLLADGLLRPSCGRGIGVLAQARDDDEWQKRITACLRDGHSVIQINNLTRPLDSGALSMALTVPIWTDRVLGLSATVRLPVRNIWVCSANHPTLSTEMARRAIRIRLDPRRDRPWEREGFRHPELIAWVDEYRADLGQPSVGAALDCWQSPLLQG